MKNRFNLQSANDRFIAICVSINSLILVYIAIYFFFLPLISIIRSLNEPELLTGSITPTTFDWHRELSDSFETWAVDRVESQAAAGLSIHNISGTEWPIFTAVYYLWATEALQQQWERDPQIGSIEPKLYAAGAIEAAAALVADPNHAVWVKAHWGDNYLHQENIFYRMLLIGGLSSYQNLANDDTYLALLEDQLHSLSAELDASPYGLLDDYPGQCYPIDILPAVALIQRSNLLDESYQRQFVVRSYRGFSGNRLDTQTNLPAYVADSQTGVGKGPARGVGISYMLIWAPELWPDVADQWYETYETHYWVSNPLVSGVQEFSKQGSWPTWFLDVDAGPVVGGVGTAASAFGIGAARSNGRLDHAYPLTAQALAVSWPLPDGTRLIPRLLSNLADAPFVGETALLFNLTRTSMKSEATSANARPLPGSVYLVLALYALGGLILLRMAYKNIVRRRRKRSLVRLEVGEIVWVFALVAAVVFMMSGFTFRSLITFGIMYGIQRNWLDKFVS